VVNLIDKRAHPVERRNQISQRRSKERSKMRKVTSVLAPALFVGSILFLGTTLVHADDDCHKRTSNVDHKLHEAIEHHGPEGGGNIFSQQVFDSLGRKTGSGPGDAPGGCYEHQPARLPFCI
jgi:hypothetical protein